MGQANQIHSCPRCGRTIKLVLQRDERGPRGLQCLGCEKFDPLKSELVSGWLNGELGRARRPNIQPK
jgi:hypothetical protein